MNSKNWHRLKLFGPPHSWLSIVYILIIPLLFFSSCSVESSRNDEEAAELVTPLATMPEVVATQVEAPTTAAAFVLPTIMPTSTEYFPPDPTPTLSAQAGAEISTCDSPGEIRLGTFPSQITGDLMNYRIYIPPCYGEDDRTYPALYLFHGSSHNDSHWEDLGIGEAAEVLINSGKISPILIVMPDGGQIAQETSGGPSSFEGVIVRELVPYIEENYCAWPDPSGRAIGGLSRGGYWAVEIAFQNPRSFFSVGGHSAALLDEYNGSQYDPLVSAQKSDIDNLRIYLDAGRSDYVLTPLLELHEILLDEVVGHQWTLNEGSHQDSYWSTHLTDYLNWYTDPWPIERGFYPDCASEPPAR